MSRNQRVTASSIESYREVKSTSLNSQCGKILQLFDSTLLQNYTLTRREIKDHFERVGDKALAETAIISARINHLIHDLKLLKEVGKRECRITGKNVNQITSIAYLDYFHTPRQRGLF